MIKIDWKKKQGWVNSWYKKNDTIDIIQDATKQVIKYHVDIYLFETPKNISKHIYSKNFKTKPKALAYAKAYMKKH